MSSDVVFSIFDLAYKSVWVHVGDHDFERIESWLDNLGDFLCSPRFKGLIVLGQRVGGCARGNLEIFLEGNI